MLGIAAIAVIVVATITVVQYRETSTWLRAIRELEGYRFATTFAGDVESVLASEDLDAPAIAPEIDRLVTRAGRDRDVADVALLAPDGRVRSQAHPGEPIPPDILARVPAVAAGRTALTAYVAPAFAYLVPIRARSESAAPDAPVSAVLYVRAGFGSIASDVAAMAWRIGLVATAVSAVGVVVLLLWLRRVVLLPTRALATQAARLAAGDLSVRSGVVAEGGNEIARLGHALDTMSGRIAEDMQRLHANEERYREVVEGAGDGIFTSDEQGILLDVNARGCALVQRTREEILGRPVTDFIHPDEGAAAEEMFVRINAGASDVREWTMRLPGDVYVPVEVNATRLPNGRLQGITREISERKKVEDGLRRVVRQQQAVAELGQRALGRVEAPELMREVAVRVADGLGAPFCQVLELAPERTWLRVRAAVGWDADLMGSIRVSAEATSQPGFTLAADRAVVVEDLRTETRFSGPGITPDHGVISGLSVVIRSSARPFGVLAVHAAERRHFTPDDVHFVESVANVLAHAVARAESEEAVRTSELRYRMAARATRDAMYDWDIVHDRMFWSEGVTLLFGHRPVGIGLGIDWWKNYIHPEDRDSILRSVEETLSSGTREWRAEYRFLRADGSFADVKDRAYVEYASDGTPVRAIGAMTDVSDHKRGEFALRRQVAFVRLAREVAVTANEAVGVADAISAILRLVCRHTGWPVGHALLLHGTDEDAPPPSLWHLDDAARFAEFRRVSDATLFQRGVGVLGQVWQTGQPVWVAEGRAPSPRRTVAIASGLHGGFAFPVLVGSTVAGVLEFLSEDEVPPGDDLVAVMGGIGAQLGRVIERAQAERHLRHYADRLESLSRRLIEAQETERRHVARELHDEIGQSLTALKLNLQTVDRGADDERAAVIEESIALAERTLQQTRDLSLDLRPALLDDLGLVPALRWYLDRQGRRAGFSTEFAADDLGDSVPPEVATTCFRIAQEALTNVARHARTTHVVMQLLRRADALELVVRDAGRGFDRETTFARAEQGGSLGLLGMRERAALVGGTLDIDSAPGRGTAVRVVLPLATSATDAEAERRTA
jgi:PAS domain S-box-containing protein